MKKIAFLGPVGTVSQEAVRYFFAGDMHTFVPYQPMSEVFAATISGETDLSVIPIENTIDGSVQAHVDMLVNEANLPIQAEWVYPSVQNLIGFSNGTGLGHETNANMANDYRHIHKIVSIEVAIAQCKAFLNRFIPHAEMVYVSSTAEGVRLVREWHDPGCAAIGTKLAAAEYGLDLLAENITNHQNNFTRFILIGHTPPVLRPSDWIKTTIIVTLPEDYPGALHQVLSAFAWRRINLTKIESRPTKMKLGSYYFYIDIEGSMDSVLLPAAIAEIEAIGCLVRLMGSYRCYPYEQTTTEV